MNKILLFFILSFCLPVHAEWSKPYTLGKKDSIKTYIDLASFYKSDDGNTIRYWMKKNYPSPDKGALSAEGVIEVNCKRNEYTILLFSSYSKIDLQGNTLYEEMPDLTFPIEDWSAEAAVKESWCVL